MINYLVKIMSNNTKEQLRAVTASNADYSAAKLSFVTGMLFLIANNLFYSFTRAEFFDIGASPSYALASLGLLATGSILVALAIFSFLSVSRKLPLELRGKSNQVSLPLRKIVGDALFGEKNVVLISGILYSIIFALLDGILIFQPTIDFHAVYGVSGNTPLVTTCCGPTGYVPVFLAFLPAAHLGIQLTPLSGLVMILVSSLVGLNLALLYRAIRQSNPMSGTEGAERKRGTLGGMLGAGVGLFAGCPTCAAAFFLSMIAGSGATVLSAFVAKYQPLILGLTVPLLLASVLWQSKSIRRMTIGCTL
jgi:hypothetical protein